MVVDAGTVRGALWAAVRVTLGGALRVAVRVPVRVAVRVPVRVAVRSRLHRGPNPNPRQVTITSRVTIRIEAGLNAGSHHKCHGTRYQNMREHSSSGSSGAM